MGKHLEQARSSFKRGGLVEEVALPQIAAKAGQCFGLAPVGYGADQYIAIGVAGRVVDDLEVIDVHQQKAKVLLVGNAGGEEPIELARLGSPVKASK